MGYSYNFLLHLIAFGFVSAAVIALFVLNRKLCAEQDWGKKLYIGGIMRSFAMSAHYTVTVLLLTGLGNMVNRYGLGSTWPEETWLTMKIVLFVILAVNALSVGPRMTKKRTMLIKSVVENNGPGNAEELLTKQNKTISIFLYIQAALLLTIVVLSVFGDGKHPGIF